jgi:8-oxo-dGTP pyrophosphatase MutT (NUDIX family)
MAKKRRGKKEEREKVKFEFSAGGVVFKKDRVLIIQPAGTNRWQLPKGHIDKGESSKIAAAREVEEEGAVGVLVKDKIGSTEYFFVLKGQKIFKKVTFYLMEYQKDLDHDPSKVEIKEVRFVPFKKALEMLTFEDDRKILQKAKKLVSKES